MIEEYENKEFVATERKKAAAEAAIQAALEEKQIIAKNLLAVGIAIEVIVQTTGLNATEIERLKVND